MIGRVLRILKVNTVNSKSFIEVCKYNFGCQKNKNKLESHTEDKSIPKPHVDGTAAEFFGRKPTIEEIQKLLSPEGLLSEIQYQDYEGVTPLGKFEQLQPQKKQKENMTEEEKRKEYLENNLNEWGMPEEVGFKVKGPEPTRFGDWERKGRVTDF
ncbi:hypothetical protein TTHERM_001106135 (macronuclear) [Tetrahymena thermophila SB210]|uniref:Uncharacterized protein n=1 Tax=Tetrahymena thermophila (strain SB210) TaxID=312017 RepID=W7X7P5_TETTS|nr:hypothetical protein TTHERM_001106135 [Tetrahymena thermophila SB210]EWS72438.1 hypothetical protein TTHERM_001106135 [Tetrahymena thermophila SB210]|eukprot:XP_012655025.1 hypothetical protein TTHERM_001106135 [Tetrahymena thermophila SB210]